MIINMNIPDNYICWTKTVSITTCIHLKFVSHPLVRMCCASHYRGKFVSAETLGQRQFWCTLLYLIVRFHETISLNSYEIWSHQIGGFTRTLQTLLFISQRLSNATYTNHFYWHRCSSSCGVPKEYQPVRVSDHTIITYANTRYQTWVVALRDEIITTAPVGQP